MEECYVTSQKTAAKETKNADVEENILPKFSWRRKGILLSHISVVGLPKPQFREIDRRYWLGIEVGYWPEYRLYVVIELG